VGPWGAYGRLELAITTQAVATLQLEVWIVMNAISILLAVSAILGLVLGFYFSWIAISVSALVLAFLSAAVLQNEGFGFLQESGSSSSASPSTKWLI
jgi:ABC-type transport system involved in cytochrome c biogenesis permease subunit